MQQGSSVMKSRELEYSPPAEHTCIIIFRNPGNGALGMIGDGDNCDDPHVFTNEAAAQRFTKISPLLRAWNHQIIEVEI
jgi:hypothetical protein